MKKILSSLLLAAMLLSFAACGGAGEEALTELWVVTEESKSDGMNLQAEMIAEAFEKSHPGITVKLEILTSEGEDRETYLQQLRTQIMAGEGPDVYLLPTGSTITIGNPNSIKELTVEPLFPDVQQSICSGLFQDISAYYDADTALNTAALHPDIMDAGCMGNGRYVLPLRFDMTVLMADEQNWAAAGLDDALQEGSLDALIQAVLDADTSGTAAYSLQLPNDLSALPRVFDYEKGELLVTQQQIADYMRLYQRWKAESTRLAQPINEKWTQYVLDTVEERYLQFYGFSSTDITSFGRLSNYNSYNLHWTTAGFPLYTEHAENLLDATLMGKRLGQNVTQRILPDTGGQTHVQVTYFGAVGSGCPQPELAYEFLRQFLTEEYQWDLYRPRIKDPPAGFSEPPEPQCYIMVEGSWPVRVYGSLAPLWDNRQYQLRNYGGRSARILAVHSSNVLSEEDFSVLTGSFDVVDFPIVQAQEETFAYALSLLNDENSQPTDVDIDKLAQQVHENLWWHLAEG